MAVNELRVWVECNDGHIKEVAINHANPQNPTMEEWEPFFDAAEDICRMLNGKVEADK